MANNGGSSSGPAIGIDLGTTKSCVAVWENNHVTIIPNARDNRTTPSCVAFVEKERFIGEDATDLSANHHANIIYDAKRLIGRRFTDETVQNDKIRWPFKVINSEDRDNKPMFEVTYKDQKKKFAAEEISSMMLLKMKEIAETHLRTKVKNAVVTVPTYFNDAQRQATKDAGTIAGLNVLSIINQPTATAIAFGLEKMDTSQNVAKNVVIFDLGGGTFDVSLVRIQDREIEVKAVKGDTHLGGSDFDDRMVEHFIAEVKLKHNKDISGDHKALRKLRIACEKKKRTLSTTKNGIIKIECLIGDIDFESSIETEKFEELNRDLFAKCMKNVKKCLRQANVEKYEVDEVVLVGGSTRIPKLRKMLREFFNGKELCTRVNADEIVAHGAAIHAAKLSGTYTKDDYKVVDVTPFSIGYKNYSSHRMEIVIPKNTIIPMKKKLIVLETHGDGDKDVTLNVFEGEKVDTRENYFLGSFKLPSKMKSSFKYNIGFAIDQNGILTISSQLLNISNDKSTIILNHGDRLSRNEIDRMFTIVNKYNTEDHQRKKYMEDILSLKENFDNMWEKLSCCKKMFGDIDKNMEDIFKEITQYMKKNSVLVEISKFEKKLKELQNI